MSLVPLASSAGVLLPVGAAMAALTAVRWRRLEPGLRRILLFQTAIVLLTPTIFPGGTPAVAAVFVGSAVLVAMFVHLMQYMYRNKQIHRPVARYMVAVGAVSIATTVGLYAVVVYGDVLGVVLGAFLQLALLLTVTVRPPVFDDERRISWPLTPFWAFQLLGTIFLAELFLGAALDVQVYGPIFLLQIPFLTPGAGAVAAVAITGYNALWFLASVCVSSWFLIVMGAEMGTLVVFKIRETREREQKVRLGLMLAAYAFGVVYLPSLWSNTPLWSIPALKHLPIVDWGMGIRTGGPFAPTFFAAVLFMYVAIGSLTVLFGRRALCSTMCGAAMMYQSTAVSAMKGFNRTSRIGQSLLGSRFSTAYTTASTAALVSLVAISLSSVFNTLPGGGRINFDVGPAMLPLELYFGAIWFVLFVSIPYVGNYNCVTTGICHWGTLSLLFSKVSFFKLKVRDPALCRSCTTVDCAKACDMGLIDMPQYFRATGEYKSGKCAGIGECAAACPYGNLYLYDVRHWVREHFGHGGPVVPPPEQRLPMVRARRAAPSTAPVAGGPTPRLTR